MILGLNSLSMDVTAAVTFVSMRELTSDWEREVGSSEEDGEVGMLLNASSRDLRRLVSACIFEALISVGGGDFDHALVLGWGALGGWESFGFDMLNSSFN